MERKKGDGAKVRKCENLLGRGEQVRRRPGKLKQEENRESAKLRKPFGWR